MQPSRTLRALVFGVGACLTAVLLAAEPARADELAEVQALVRQGSLGPASDRLNAFLAKNPKDARARFLRGLILTEQKRPAEAIKVFVALTDDYPELPEPYNNLAVLYAAQGQFDRARQMLEMAIRTHPSYATAHENLGDIYAKMASEAYDKALQLDRSNKQVQTKLALIRELFSTSTQFQAQPLVRLEPPRQVAIAGPALAADALAAKAASPAPATAGPPAPATAGPPASAARPVLARPAEPASPPAPAASPLPPPAAAVSAATTPAGVERILATVQAWAQAWSGNDVEGYLAFYAQDFKVPGGDSRAAWEQMRRERIAKPRQIEVRVLGPQISPIDANRVAVAFRQDYRSGTLKSNAPKTLTLVRVGEQWLIEQEQLGR